MKNKRVIGILCFRDMSNEIIFLLFQLILSSGLCATFIHVRVMTNLRMEQKINSRTKGMQGDLKVGDR